ncbi:MAG: Ig-like domain-containing protein, partial [Pseudomonadota bacterium]
MTTAILDRIQVEPASSEVPLGLHAKLIATGHYTDNSTEDLTAQATWTSSDNGIAAFSSKDGEEGWALGVAEGDVTVSAERNGVSGSGTVKVTPAVVVAIEVAAAEASIADGLHTQLTAVGTFSDGTTRDITADVTWTSDHPDIATVSNADGDEGLTTGQGTGKATATATLGGVSGSFEVTVTDALLVSIQVYPLEQEARTIPLGHRIQLEAIGLFTNATTNDLTDEVTWASSNGNVATVSNAAGSRGLATTTADSIPGETIITATFPVAGAGDIVGETKLTVTDARLESVAVQPGLEVAVPLGLSMRLRLVGTFTDGVDRDVGHLFNWTSSVPARIYVTNSGETKGTVTANAPGAPVTVTARYEDPQTGLVHNFEILVRIAPAELMEVTVELVDPAQGIDLPVGMARHLRAMGHFSDANVVDLTGGATWSVAPGDEIYATVSNIEKGRVSGVGRGIATIVATVVHDLPDGSDKVVSGESEINVVAAVITGIAVTNDSGTKDTPVALGSSHRFKATATMSDSSQLDISELVTWSSSDPFFAEVSNAPGSRGLAFTRHQTPPGSPVVIRAAVPEADPPIQDEAHMTVLPPVTYSVEVACENDVIIHAGRTHCVANALTSDGVKNITSSPSLVWSLDPASGVAHLGPIVVEGKVVFSDGAGTVKVTATFQVGQPADWKSGSFQLQVSTAVLDRIELVWQGPPGFRVPAGQVAQVRAFGHYSDGTQQDLTADATWASSNTTVATVSGEGLVTAIAQGSSVVSATSGVVSAELVVQVSAAIVDHLTLSPAAPSRPVGTLLPFTVSAFFSDGSTADVSADAEWSSSSTGVAAIAAGGEATCVAQGLTTITATWGGKTVNTVLSVSQATPIRIEVQPLHEMVPAGARLQYHATVFYSDGSFRDETGGVTWSSSVPAVATVSNTDKGFAVTLAAGSTAISATRAGLTGSANLEVTSATLQDIILSATKWSIPAGTTTQLTATGRYSDGTTTDITAEVEWESANPAIATISNASGSQGLVTGVTAGAVDISASSGALSRTVQLNVSAATIISLSIEPNLPEQVAGGQVPFHAFATLSDGDVVDVTGLVGWISGNALVADVDNSEALKGLAYCHAAGTSTITAQITVAGQLKQATTTLTVTSAVLEVIEIRPRFNLEFPAGSRLRLEAWGIYSDRSVREITGDATWTSANSAIATVGNSEYAGQVTTVSAGLVGITASVTLGDDSVVSDSVSLDVTTAVLTRLEVTPAYASIAKGVTARLNAVGFYSDGTDKDITSIVNWSSLSPGVAIVNEDGVAEALGQGTATIQAALPDMPLGVSPGTAVLTVTAATVEEIVVEPLNVEIASGLRHQFHALAILSDGRSNDVTGIVSWASSDGDIAAVSNASESKGQATGVAAGTVTVNATFVPADGEPVVGRATLVVTDANLQALELAPLVPRVPAGNEIQLEALGHYSDGSIKSITDQVTWSSADSSIATVSNADGSRGIAAGAAAGSVAVSAATEDSLGNTRSASVLLVVSQAVLTGIDVTPQGRSLPAGYILGLTATGSFSDGSTRNITEEVIWASNATNVATVNSAAGSKGQVHGEAAGVATITASRDAHSFEVEVVVTSATLSSMVVNPQFFSLPAGNLVQYHADGFFSDGTRKDLTADVTWESSNTDVASTGNLDGEKGVVSAVAQGSATISATFVDVDDQATTASAALEVTAATLQLVEVTPIAQQLAAGTILQYQAWGHYSDHTVHEVTDDAIWSSGSSSVAVISNGANDKGLATGIAQGITSVTATVGAKSGSTTLIVTSAVLQSLEIVPPDPRIAAGTRIQLNAIGTFSDHSVRDVTGMVTWSSDDTDVATASNVEGDRGIVYAAAQGSATISATFTPAEGDPVSASTELTVTAALLAGIDVNPYNPTIPAGTTVALNATGHYSDGSAQDITGQVVWSSGSINVAAVSNEADFAGLVTGGAAGTSVISARLGDKSGSVTVNVTAAILSGIEVLPPDASIANGTRIGMRAIGHFSDGSVRDITGGVSWSSSDSSVAVASNATGEAGVVLALAEGNCVITATRERELDAVTITGEAALTVSAATLVGIDIAPWAPLVPRGVRVQMEAFGHFTDGSVQDITGQVVWSSSAPAVAAVSNVDGEKGLATALGQGTTTVAASLGSISRSISFAVAAAEVTTMEVQPTEATIAKGTRLQYRAYGHLTDGSTVDLTGDAAWSSSAAAIAVVSNADDARGLATGLDTGTATISATFVRGDGQAVQGSASLAVSSAT